MRKVTVLAAALLLAFSMQAADLTVDEILAKNIEAKGGAEKLKALKSIRFSGKMAMGGGMEAPFVMTKKRPEMTRLDITIQGMTATIQAYDGKTAWNLMPFLGKKDAEPQSGDVARAIKLDADFDGSTWDYKAKGHKVELLGKADIEGTPAYKVKLITSDASAESVIYYDAESFLEIKTESKTKIQGQDMEQETTVGNYQEFEGLLFPTSLELKSKGAASGQSITIDKVEINPEIADDTFRMPVKKAEPAAAETKQ